MGKGKVYLIGAGPAGRDLMTVKALEILRQADVVIYDYLAYDKGLLDRARPDAEFICCEELGKHRKKATAADSQKRIGALIVSRAKSGKNVVRLKNGDPLIFGRSYEEIEALRRNGIEFEIVPGITAAQAAASFSGIPLTDRGLSSSVVFVAGHEAAGKKESATDWRHISGIPTIVLYMSVKNISKVATELIWAGKSAHTPVAAISNAGKIDQKIVLAELSGISSAVRRGQVTAPAVFIIGETVALGKKFNWFEKNRRILFTGLSDSRYFLKGTYLNQPMIKIEPLDDYREFDRCLKKIHEFDWIVFTSRFGVQYFFERLNRAGFDARILHNIKVAAIGASTARRLRDFTVNADLVPKDESSKGLLASLKKVPLRGKKIFLPRSDISDKGLTHGLRKLGAEVTASIAYRNVMPEDLPDLDIDSFDEIVFTSPSGVRNFIKRYGKPPGRIRIRCIGDVTRAQAERLHLL